MNESEKAVHHNVYGLSHIRHDVRSLHEESL